METTKNRDLTIKKVALKSDVGIETIRFYERKGLITPIYRSAAGYRFFSDLTIKRIRFIKRAQAVGFSLSDIKELLSLRQSSLNARREVYQKTIEKIDMVSEKIKELKKIKYSLEKLVDCCKGQGPIEECPIIEAFESDLHQNKGEA
ncbi:MAG: MerR family transcriptional regulator [Alphaproteobacteria bacterium]|nr:MerR family transcriptional regulator [Alphaproteobacteria bacterium]